MQRINRLIAICIYGDVGNESTSAEGKNQDFSDTDDFINADDDDDDDDDDSDIMDDGDDDGSNDGSGISDNDDDNIGADDRHFGHERRHRHNFSQLHWIQQPDLYEEFEFNPTSGNGLFETCTNERWLRERNYKKLFSPARHLVMSFLALLRIFSINFDSIETCTNEQWLRERNYKKLFSPARHLVMSFLALLRIFSINFDSMNQLKGSSRNNGFLSAPWLCLVAFTSFYMGDFLAR